MTLRHDDPLSAPALDDTVRRWSMPLGQVGRTHISIAHAVLVAAAGVVAVVALTMHREGNADLARAALIGTTFWVAGWGVQGASLLTLAGGLGLRFRCVGIGLLGVEVFPHRWAAKPALAISMVGIGALMLCGIAIGWLSPQPAAAERIAAVPDLWPAPSLGMADSDSIWRAGAWLWCVQAIAQLIPLPRTLGRLGAVALITIVFRGLPRTARAARARRGVAATALGITALGIALVPVGAANLGQAVWSVPAWLLILVLAALVWRSSRYGDIEAIMRGFDEAGRVGIAADQTESVWNVYRRRRDDRRRRRRMADALQRERGEAVDAARLDEILQQLHRGGPTSISSSDRAVLERVSKTLREHREQSSSRES